jgi:hypothetical protein
LKIATAFGCLVFMDLPDGEVVTFTACFILQPGPFFVKVLTKLLLVVRVHPGWSAGPNFLPGHNEARLYLLPTGLSRVFLGIFWTNTGV